MDHICYYTLTYVHNVSLSALSSLLITTDLLSLQTDTFALSRLYTVQL